MTAERPPLPPVFRPLTDRVAGPRRGLGDIISRGAGIDRRLVGAAFAPLDSRRKLADAIEGGTAAVIPLALVHGCFVLNGFFGGDVERVARHGALTVLALLCYYAVLYGRTIWPSVFVLAWLLTEIIFGPYFDYRLGRSILNFMALPLAVLAVRASWRRAQSDCDTA